MAVNFSNEEFTAIVEAAADFSDYRSGQYFAKRETKPPSGAGSALRLLDASTLPPWAVGLRRMLSALADFDFNSTQAPSLVTLCEAGARYGWQELEAALAPKLLALISSRAKRRLKRDLQRILERATRPCLELERTSYNLALAAIGLQETTTDPKFVERKFLGEKPSERLFSMFRKFPCLVPALVPVDFPMVRSSRRASSQAGRGSDRSFSRFPWRPICRPNRGSALWTIRPAQ